MVEAAGELIEITEYIHRCSTSKQSKKLFYYLYEDTNERIRELTPTTALRDELADEK